jgi:SAM-dependent methyltransferase
MPKALEQTICPLCKSNAKWFCDYFNDVVEFFKCENCHGIFKSLKSYPKPETEKARYQTHNNDVHDRRYQQFVSPITDAVQDDFENTSVGLDYGCGTGPVATHVLEKQGYSIKLYDPFFYPDENYENQLYDFIICCEVMEHFFHPDKEFSKLKKLLKSNSKLYCKTKMISNTMSVEDFKNWYYKDDPTHVFFYTPRSLVVICGLAKFKSVNFNDNLIIFST